MKLQPSVSISNSDRQGLLAVRFDYKYENLRAELKQLAGVTWDPSKKVWLVAEEYYLEVGVLARKYGLMVTMNLASTGRATTAQPNYDNEQLPKAEWGETSLDTRLHDYQREGVQAALRSRAFMLNYEMGLGKTPTAIETLKHSGAKNILVISPAMVRLTWLEELTKWWPQAFVRVIEKKTDWGSVFYSKSMDVPAAHISITSYGLLDEASKQQWDGIVLDESHYIKERNSQRSKQALALRKQNPNALMLLLTATPITSEPQDLWHQLEVMYPGRFGTYWQFVKRYCRTQSNQWGGVDVWGINEAYQDELQKRLATVSMRVTKHEVAHLLPPFTTIGTKVEIGSKRLKEITAEFDGALQHKAEMNNFVLTAGHEKVPMAVERALDVVNGGQTHVMVLTWFRETGHAISELLKQDKKRGKDVLYIDGDFSPSQRSDLLSQAKQSPSSIIVSTMASIREGIDLTKYTYVIFAELYWQHAMVEQTLGRYHRLSSQVPAVAEFLIIKGTLDEIIARTLIRRGKDIGKIFKKGVSGEKMAEALGVREQTEEEALKELREIAAGRDSFDEYT